MSDDELPPAGIDGDEDMDNGDISGDDMGDAGGDYSPPPELPVGIKKEIITEAPAGNWKKPKKGDEVTVHYVGTLQSDGSEFDSSRSRDEPFVFTLGRGQVIKGWDQGVATMKKGEVAKFILDPEYAYGDAGSPPKIPEKATLIFEVELISWMSKDDLFGDEGVIKTQIKEGTGWKTPKSGDEVMMSLKVEAPDRTVLEERGEFEYTIGSGLLGAISQACDKALTGMKKAEEASLKCSKDYMHSEKCPEGGTISLKLQEIYEIKDVSFGKDKTLMKKQVKEGEGYDTPKDASKVNLSVVAATDGSLALPGFEAKTLEFIVGNGEVCDALECAASEMKKGEKAVLTVMSSALAAEPQLGLKDVAVDKVILTLELTEFEKPKETWNMSEEEKIEFAVARKEIGAGLFKCGRISLALQRYKKIAELFSYIDNFKEENKTKAKELKNVCELNKAACYLKLKEHTEAKKSCDAVLKDESQNIKAIYRRAQAEMGLKNFPECIRDCKKVVDLDARNKDARTLLQQAQQGQKEEDKKSKGLFANMCKALGKGPLPEPHKTTRPREDEVHDGDDGEEDLATSKDEAVEGADVAASGEAEEASEKKDSNVAAAVAA